MLFIECHCDVERSTHLCYLRRLHACAPCYSSLPSFHFASPLVQSHLHDLSKVHQLGRPVNTGVVVRIENQIKREGSHEVNKKKRLAVLLGNLLPFEAEVTVIFPSDNVKASEEVQKDVNCEAASSEVATETKRPQKGWNDTL